MRQNTAFRVANIIFIKRNKKGLDASAEFNLVPQWWCFRLTLHLLDDLWPSQRLAAHRSVDKTDNLGDKTLILSATLIKICRLSQPIPVMSKGVLTAKVAPDRQSVIATYYGSENLW